MKNFTVKLVELGNPFLDIVDVRWGRFHKLKFKLQKKSKKQFDFSVSCGFFIENFDLTNKDDFPATAWSFFDFRDNYLVEIAEELGFAFLIGGHSFKIVEIPFDVKYNIECDDSGREWVAEVHRIWN
jgi:hypothetical protein